MSTYIITESTDLNAFREGQVIEVGSLTKAKQYASRQQVFHDTVLKVEDEHGELLAYKNVNQEWVTL